jgi:glycosyltransferase involved in cell wall biosynthesis
MKISIYTTVKNGLYFDYHIVHMLKHHLPFADEIVVNEGFSTDGTYEAISSIDPRIKVFRETWDVPGQGDTMYRRLKEAARRRCTGDWCILLDCDEFIPEWEFDRIRAFLPRAAKSIIALRWVHFYGNYRVYHTDPGKVMWAVHKHQVHRNTDEIEVWGDGSNVIVKSNPGLAAVDFDNAFECHHFGQVRHSARLRHKWRIQHKLLREDVPHWDRVPGVVFNLAPHDWFDPQFLDDLDLYPGQQVQAVRDDPKEFVRDDFKLVKYLEQRRAAGEQPAKPLA